MRARRLQLWHFWSLLILLLAGGAVVKVWERAGEARAARRELREFPSRVGDWRQQSGDVHFDADTEGVLRADDYLSREYVLMTNDGDDAQNLSLNRERGRVANFYVGYYASQRSGATYHSPLNCLPGAGWTMNDHKLVQITPVESDGARRLPAFAANRYVIQNGSEKELLVYWYQGRGRALASEYWGKIYTVWDGIKRRRSDGAMVRVMIPLRGDGGASEESAAEHLAVDFAARVAPLLSDYVPN